MIDFHTHILPGVDDGPQTLGDSLSMLSSSFRQGVDVVISTSHFYANDDYPEEFLKRRNEAAERLDDAMLLSADIYPRVILGSEVLYFPGMAESKEIAQLRIGDSKGILIEPPMAPWSDQMLDEIVQLGQNFDLIPVIAHVDRYMTVLRNLSLIDRVLQRNLMVQVNGTYFLNPKTQKAAFANLKAGKIHLLGSDCHNLVSRPPNLGTLRKLARTNGAEKELQQLHQNAAELLMNRSE